MKKRKKREKTHLPPHANIKNKKTTPTNCTTTGWRNPADTPRRVSVSRESWGSAPFTSREPELWVCLDFNCINDLFFKLHSDYLSNINETCFMVTSNTLLLETWVNWMTPLPWLDLKWGCLLSYLKYFRTWDIYAHTINIITLFILYFVYCHKDLQIYLNQLKVIFICNKFYFQCIISDL